MAAEKDEIYVTVSIGNWAAVFGHLADQAFLWRQRQLQVLDEDGKQRSSIVNNLDSAFSCSALLALATLVECYDSRLKWKIWYKGLADVRERFGDAEDKYQKLKRHEIFALFSDEPLEQAELNEVLSARNCIAHGHIWTYKLHGDDHERVFLDHQVGWRRGLFQTYVDQEAWVTNQLRIPVIASQFHFTELAKCARAVDKYVSQWRSLNAEVDAVCQRSPLFSGRLALAGRDGGAQSVEDIVVAVARAGTPSA